MEKITLEHTSRSPEALLDLSRSLDDVTGQLGWWDQGVGAGKRLLLQAENLIKEAECYASAVDIGAAVRELKEQSRPASQTEVKRQLQILIGSFPNAPKHDLQLYGTAMVEDVLEERPSILALSNACRTIRRTSRFLPTISEVLGVLENEMSRQFDRIEAAQEFERRIGLAKCAFEEARKKIDAAFEFQVQIACRQLRWGNNTAFLPQEVLDEARKRAGGLK
ncbi:hypothetical protein [Bradyrhizobium sp. CCBAU 53340]|uniref:hypothetical protein n=1 Tax=Bradyrhizobium sp. CCBAU 53340 TaxID=1325112 RepID=UPI00188B7C91|nr:hypothetical protein [Bradyrhizobium sp. CCBAU 53340]